MQAPKHSLYLSQLQVKNFRNWEDISLSFDSGLTIFVGANAVGKTSLIEAIQLNTALHSFRATNAAHMVKWGADIASIDTKIVSDHRTLDVLMTIKDGRRFYQLNGKGKRIVDLKGQLPAVSFIPDDLHLVKGSASARRDAIDSIGTQISRNFYSVRSDYMKLLKQKNQALKDEVSDDYLDSIDEVLVLVGVQLMSHRVTLLKTLQPYFEKFYQSLTQGSMSYEYAEMKYRPSWVEDIVEGWEFDKKSALSEMRDSLRSLRAQERIRKRSLVGPHADFISFFINKHDAVHYASQGQQRSCVLAYKLAESATVQEILHQQPILLLDDVMSELDSYRRDCFMRLMSPYMQTYITTTNLEYFSQDMLRQAHIIQVEELRHETI